MRAWRSKRPSWSRCILGKLSAAMGIGLWAEELTMPKRNMVAVFTHVLCLHCKLLFSCARFVKVPTCALKIHDFFIFSILNGKIARRMLLKSRVPGPCDAGSAGSGASWYSASCKIVELFAARFRCWQKLFLSLAATGISAVGFCPHGVTGMLYTCSELKP